MLKGQDRGGWTGKQSSNAIQSVTGAGSGPLKLYSKMRLLERDLDARRAANLQPVINIHQRVDNDTPSCAAFTVVAAGVRLRDFDILVTPAFALAIALSVRTSSLVQERLAAFALLLFAVLVFSVLAILLRSN